MRRATKVVGAAERGNRPLIDTVILDYAQRSARTLAVSGLRGGQFDIALDRPARLRTDDALLLDDGALVEVDDDTRQCKGGDEVWIPANARHRLSCSGDRPVRVLEVAFGNWQQDDITRYEDDYARPEIGE
jgi:hypothetical protein